MPDDDSMLGQNMVDVRNEARREYQRRQHLPPAYVKPPTVPPPKPSDSASSVTPVWFQQTAICTSDPTCQAAADEHNPDCPIEQSLQHEFGGF